MRIVYRITNSLNGRVYIGSTQKSLPERFKQHISCAKRGQTELYRDIRLLGKEFFYIEEINSYSTNAKGFEAEKFWINLHFCTNNIYNSRRFAEWGIFLEEKNRYSFIRKAVSNLKYCLGLHKFIKEIYEYQSDRVLNFMPHLRYLMLQEAFRLIYFPNGNGWFGMRENKTIFVDSQNKSTNECLNLNFKAAQNKHVLNYRPTHIQQFRIDKKIKERSSPTELPGISERKATIQG